MNVSADVIRILETPAVDVVSSPSSFRLLPATPLSLAERLIGSGAAMAITAGYCLILLTFWAPAHSGVDQNAYFHGGRQFARDFTTAYTPKDDFAFVGRMFIRTDDGRSFPKYPVGLPMMFAGCLWIFGDGPNDFGFAAAHLISPACAALSLLGVFYLCRCIAGTFAGLLGMIVLGFNYLTFQLGLNPNSHAAAMACVTWGMLLLIRFMQTGTLWRGLTAGFLLGFAYLIRYTEGLLVLPLLAGLLMCVRWRVPGRATLTGQLIGVMCLAALIAVVIVRTDFQPRTFVLVPVLLGTATACFLTPASLGRCLLVGAAWLVPIGFQTGYNLYHLGTITSYDNTNESTGFGVDFFLQNWERMLRTMQDTNLFLFFSIGLLGLCIMFARQTRLAVMLWLWMLPCVLIYAAYYWAPDTGTGYARFFLTVVPCGVVGAMWLMNGFVESARGRSKNAVRVAIGAIVLLAGVVATSRARDGVEVGVREGGRGSLEQTHRDALNLWQLGEWAVRTIPAGSVVISDEQRLHHFQWVGDWQLFSVDMFDDRAIRRVIGQDRDETEPDPLDPKRVAFLRTLYENKKDADLKKEMLRIINSARAEGRRVFVVLPEARAVDFEKRYVGDPLQTKLIEDWSDLPALPPGVDRLPADQRPRQAFTRGPRGPGGPAGRGPSSEPQAWQFVEVR
jgi:4-amino-4-deoxy-L-arabinose transferase-like glycosyltransferase